MIDERKIKRELSGLIRSTQEGTIERKIYQTFLEYISRQKVISFVTLRFYERMGMYFAAAGAEIAIEQRRTNGIKRNHGKNA